jgi:hypothetical protein
LLRHQRDDDDTLARNYERESRIRSFCRYLPRMNQAYLLVRGIIFFEDILIIDDKGDSINAFPHIFVDFTAKTGPFRWLSSSLKNNSEEIEIGDEFKRISFFPKVFPESKPAIKITDRVIRLDEQSAREFRTRYFLRCLFDVDRKYEFLDQRNIVRVENVNPEPDEKETFIEITSKYKIMAKEFLDRNQGDGYRMQIERQINRQMEDSEEITVLEFEIVSS